MHWDVKSTLLSLYTILPTPFKFREEDLNANVIQLMNGKLYLFKVGKLKKGKLASLPAYCVYFPGLRLGVFITDDPNHNLKAACACENQNKNGAKSHSTGSSLLR